MSSSDAWIEGSSEGTEINRLALKIRPRVSDDQLERLRSLLRPMRAHYRRVMATTPTEFSLSQRLEWLDTQVLNPLDKLLVAVGPDNRSMFSMWPEEVDDALLPDLDEVGKHLEHLQLFARNVAIVVAKYRFHDLPFGQLIRYRIVHAIADAVAEALPQLKPSRGTYDKETKGFNGIYPDLIRAIYQEITSEGEQLDHLIKEQVKQRRM